MVLATWQTMLMAEEMMERLVPKPLANEPATEHTLLTAEQTEDQKPI